jgi:uncharacterized protein YcbX
MGSLASIHFYPLKAAKGLGPASAVVEPWGLAGDRRWLIVDTDGRFVSQREHAKLALLTVTPTEGGVTLSAADHLDLAVAVPDRGPLLDVTVWRSTVAATPAGTDADTWLSAFLDTDVRLVYLDDPTRRPVDPHFGRPEDRVSFADGYPVLLTSTASLSALNGWLAETGDSPLPMNRFRPNVVVDGFAPWAEDNWTLLRIGEVTFRSVKPCGRCVVTTTDQDTAVRGRQPLAALTQHRRVDQDVLFGQNLIPDGRGTIRVGDPVEVLG